jgi:anthranilate synthase component 2
MKPAIRLLMIDNYDSFTYNLVQYFGELGAEVVTVRNDAYSVDQCLAGHIPGLNDQAPDAIVVSPGPCSPTEAGVSVALIQAVAAMIKPMPLLGVCLGHQSIGQAFGGQIIRAKTIMHGKTSAVSHTNQSVFKGLPNPYTVIRYHSLAIERQSLPDILQVTAQTEDGEIMGVMHKTLPIHGVQFHPESILTEHGHALLKNFLQMVPA